MAKTDDRQVDRLVINRMTRKIYNELSAQPGKLSDYELYLIDDDVIDAFNKRIVNVEIPVDQNDAINKEYADNMYISKEIITPEVLDYSKTYNKVVNKNNGEKFQNGDTYIDGNLDVYQKDTQTIHATEIISGDFQLSDVNVSWTTDHGGIWIVNYPGVTDYEKWTDQADPLVDSFTYSSSSKSVKFKVSSWKKIDTLVKTSVISNDYIKKSVIKEVFKDITLQSDLSTVISAIIELRNL